MKELQEKIEDYTRFGQILRCKYIVNGWLIDSEWNKRNIATLCYDGEHCYIFKFILLFLSACESDERRLEGNECE